MEFLLNWVKGVMGCLLVMSMILQCMPGKVYRPYLRLFMGIVLILTILSPLTENLGVSGMLESLMGELSYRESDHGWEEKLLEGNDWAREQIVAGAKALESEAQEEIEGKENNEVKIEIEVGEIPLVSIPGGE